MLEKMEKTVRSLQFNKIFRNSSFVKELIKTIDSSDIWSIAIYCDRINISGSDIFFSDKGLSNLERIDDCKILAEYILHKISNNNSYTIKKVVSETFNLGSGIPHSVSPNTSSGYTLKGGESQITTSTCGFALVRKINPKNIDKTKNKFDKLKVKSNW